MNEFNMTAGPAGPDPKRLLFAVILTSAVLMTYSYFFAPAPTPTPIAQATKDEETDAKEPLERIQKKEAIALDAHREATTSDTPVVEHFFERLQPDEQRTSYRAMVSNRGGAINKFELTDFGENRLLFDEQGLNSSLLKLSSSTTSAQLKPDAIYEVADVGDHHIALRHVSKEGLEVVRTYRFKDRGLVTESITFNNLASSPLKLKPKLFANKLDKKSKEPGLLNPGVEGQTIAVKSKGKHEKYKLDKLIDDHKSISDVNYVSFDDQFFLSAIIPAYSDNIDRVEISAATDDQEQKIAKINLIIKPFILDSGEGRTFEHQFFMGPKQVDLLSSLPVPLDENVDFGWFGVLSRPMLWLLVQINGLVNNYGLAIILITLIIKLLTFPLTQKSFSSQQEMKKMQPKIKELQKKFGHDRTLLGQKQMELYKSHGINPVAGCLPLLIQLPIWFAFFQMLRNSVELYDQPFYWWINDLTLPDPYYVLPVLMGISMFVQQAFTPPPADQPHMKYVMGAMPLFLTFIMLNMPSGLSLYILTNNLLTIVQQIIIKKRAEKINA